MNFCPECRSVLKSKYIDGIERAYCEQSACDFVLWDNPTPVVAAIVKYKDKILLAQNSAWPDARYSFITGYLERQEHPEQAVLREVKEELDLTAEVDQFVGHFIFHDKNQLLMVYSVNAHGSINLNYELNAYKLLSIDEISENIFSHPEFAQSVIMKYIGTL